MSFGLSKGIFALADTFFFGRRGFVMKILDPEVDLITFVLCVALCLGQVDSDEKCSNSKDV